MTIAVDFDGTIVEHRYPEIGEEIPLAIHTLLQLQADHHVLILWTVRRGRLLQEAIDYCRRRGLEFYAVNANYPGEPASDLATDDDGQKAEVSPSCRKITADVYIDDRSLGGLPDWGVIYELIHGHHSLAGYYRHLYTHKPASKPSLWKRLLGGK